MRDYSNPFEVMDDESLPTRVRCRAAVAYTNAGRDYQKDREDCEGLTKGEYQMRVLNRFLRKEMRKDFGVSTEKLLG